MLTLICGFPRAGKTTYSERYKNQCQILHFDEIQSYSAIVQQAQHTTGDLVVDGIYYFPHQRIDLVQAYAGKTTRCILINTDLQIREKRANNLFMAQEIFIPPTYDEGWDDIIIINNNTTVTHIDKNENLVYNIDILNFIHRFPNANWMGGNCYYFAVILKDRFPEGQIYYDVIKGHFMFKFDNIFYDWNGAILDPGTPILWETFEKDYDGSQYKNIVENCIK